MVQVATAVAMKVTEVAATVVLEAAMVAEVVAMEVAVATNDRQALSHHTLE